MLNQFSAVSLGTTQRFQSRRLKSALLRVTAALAKRPEPSGRWDDLARAEDRATTLFRAVEMCRQALEQASREGVLAETRANVLEFFEELRAAALYGFTDGLDLMDATQITRRVSREFGEAIAATVDARESDNTGAWDAARSRLQQVCDLAGSAVAVLEATRHPSVRAVR